MNQLSGISKKIRLKCLEICYRHKASHLGGAFSITDILTVLYFDFLKVNPELPNWELRDRLFYSKGHACTALYAVLEERGFYSGLVEKFAQTGSFFTSHVNHKIPGVYIYIGRLVHCIPVA
jgi:transketolase